MANLPTSSLFWGLKTLQLQGGFAPLTPWPGALPLDPAGGSAPRPPLQPPPPLQTPWPRHWPGVHDVITCADLYYDRLRGLGVAGGQILAFFIDLLRRPYSTLALPCECVMYYITTGYCKYHCLSCLSVWWLSANATFARRHYPISIKLWVFIGSMIWLCQRQNIPSNLSGSNKI